MENKGNLYVYVGFVYREKKFECISNFHTIFSNNGVEGSKKIVFLNIVWTKSFPLTKAAEVKCACLILSGYVYSI